MSGKRSANVHSNDAADSPPTNSPKFGYSANREFNQWWEHWMSKIPHNRLRAKGTLTKNAPDKFRYPSGLDDSIREKDAA